MAVLRATQGGNPGQLFPLDGDSAVLGRHPDCDIVLESGAVSRQHARISRIGPDYFIEDLGSRNGTFVNDRAIVDRQLLHENDALAICELTFEFHRAPPVSDDSQRPREGEATAMIVDDGQDITSSTVLWISAHCLLHRPILREMSRC